MYGPKMCFLSLFFDESATIIFIYLFLMYEMVRRKETELWENDIIELRGDGTYVLGGALIWFHS